MDKEEDQAIRDEAREEAILEHENWEQWERDNNICPKCGGDLIGKGLKTGMLICRDCRHRHRIEEVE